MYNRNQQGGALPSDRSGHVIRARLRYMWAILSEFRAPLLWAVVMTVGVGMAYGALYEGFYPDETIPVWDRPYIIVQLMTLEGHGEGVPPEPALAFFWYVMPVVLALLLGMGFNDFVRLFFSRDDQPGEWTEALASTFRDHVIVLGAGHVGKRVIQGLRSYRADVVVIDNDPSPEMIKKLREWRMPLIVGDARLLETLYKAGLERAEVFVACTDNDHLNVEVVMKARTINETARLVARIWDDKYINHIQQPEVHVEAVLSVPELTAPIFTGAALGIDLLPMMVDGVVYCLVSQQIAVGSVLDGWTIDDLQEHKQVDAVLHRRGGQTYFKPGRRTRLESGDTLAMFMRYNDFLVEASNLVACRRVIVMGAGHIGMRVIGELCHMGFHVTAVDDRVDEDTRENLQKLNARLVVGRGQSISKLEEAGIDAADAFIACTGDDHANLEAVMEARSRQPQIRLVSRIFDDTLAPLIQKFFKVQYVLSSSDLAAPAFVGAALNIEMTLPLHHDDEVYQLALLVVESGSLLMGHDMEALQALYNMDAVLHRRANQETIRPGKGVVAMEGDKLVIFAREADINRMVADNRDGNGRRGRSR